VLGECRLFDATRKTVAPRGDDTHMRSAAESQGPSLADRATLETVHRYVTVRWRKHLESILERAQRRRHRPEFGSRRSMRRASVAMLCETTTVRFNLDEG
jgi:hypothetical protein